MQRSSEANLDSVHNLKDKFGKAFPLWKKKQQNNFPPYRKKTSKTFSASLGMRIITGHKDAKSGDVSVYEKPAFQMVSSRKR